MNFTSDLDTPKFKWLRKTLLFLKDTKTKERSNLKEYWKICDSDIFNSKVFINFQQA